MPPGRTASGVKFPVKQAFPARSGRHPPLASPPFSSPLFTHYSIRVDRATLSQQAPTPSRAVEVTLRQILVSIDAAIAQKGPVGAYQVDFVELTIGRDDLIAVVRAPGDQFAAR